MLIKDKDEIISYIQDATPDEKRFIAKQLTFWIPGYQFMPSFRAGFTDGKKRFFKTHQGLLIIPKGLAPLICKSLDIEQIPYTYEQSTTQSALTFEDFNNWVQTLNIPFEPYDYQLLAAYESIINKRHINLMATGSGKSLTIYLIIRWLLQNSLKSVIVVPSIMLVNQLFSDFMDYGWINAEDFVHRIGGEHKIKHFDNFVTITTWQSIYKSSELFNNIDAVLIDECLDPETLIHTEHGLIPIKNIDIGDLVYTLNEDSNQIELKSVIKKHINLSHSQEFFEIQLLSGSSLKVTGNHKVKLTNGCWTRVDELKVGDNIINYE
jgi:hypothetical protein